MPRRKEVTLEPVLTFDRSAILDVAHVAAALRCGMDKVPTLDLPCFWVGTRQKFIWGQVLDELAERAHEDAQPEEAPARRRRKQPA